MAIIWGGAVGMIALSIPLAAILHDSAALLLPLAVIVGATIVTSRIWGKSLPVVLEAAPEPLRQNLRLEERLSNLETILTREDWSLKERIERLENK